MSTKEQNITDPESCWHQANPDEPVFVLRAKDPLAPMVVRIWASLSEQMKVHEHHKSGAAYHVAIQMRDWYEKMYGKPTHDWNK